MNRYNGYRETPKPPADIWAAMVQAGADHDDLALGVLHATYATWLWDVHGIRLGTHGTNRPDGAVR